MTKGAAEGLKELPGYNKDGICSGLPHHPFLNALFFLCSAVWQKQAGEESIQVKINLCLFLCLLQRGSFLTCRFSPACATGHQS
jgi:hypothetical protein